MINNGLLQRVEILEQRFQAKAGGKWYQNCTPVVYLCWYLEDVNGGQRLTNAEFEQLSGLHERWPLSPADDDRIAAYFANIAEVEADRAGVDVWQLYSVLHADDNAADFLELDNGFNESHRLVRGAELGISDNQLVMLWYSCRCFLSKYNNQESE